MLNVLLRMWCVRRAGKDGDFGDFGVLHRIAEADALFRYIRHSECPVAARIGEKNGSGGVVYSVAAAPGVSRETPQAVPRPVQ